MPTPSTHQALGVALGSPSQVSCLPRTSLQRMKAALQPPPWPVTSSTHSGPGGAGGEQLEQERNQGFPICPLGWGYGFTHRVSQDWAFRRATKAKELIRNLEPPGYEPHSRRPVLDSSAGVSPIPAPHPQAPSVELGRTDQRFSGSKGEAGTPDKGWAGLFEGEALCWQIRRQGKVSKCPQFDTRSPPQTPRPRERRKIRTFWHSPGSSRLKSEWPLPSPESATSSPGGKKKNTVRGKWGSGVISQTGSGGHRALRNEM